VISGEVGSQAPLVGEVAFDALAKIKSCNRGDKNNLRDFAIKEPKAV